MRAVFKVLVPQALPSLVAGLRTTVGVLIVLVTLVQLASETAVRLLSRHERARDLTRAGRAPPQPSHPTSPNPSSGEPTPASRRRKQKEALFVRSHTKFRVVYAALAALALEGPESNRVPRLHRRGRAPAPIGARPHVLPDSCCML